MLHPLRSCLDSQIRRYSTFFRIGTGLTYADYVWLRQKPWKEFDKKDIPAWYQAAKRGTDDKGDVYLEPEECVRVYKCSFCVPLIAKTVLSY